MQRAWSVGIVLAIALAACSGDTAETTSTTALFTTTTPPTTLVSTTSTTIPPTTTTTEPPPALNEESILTLRALGPVILGMTLAEAVEASGLEFESGEEISEGCFYATAGATMKGVAFMVYEDLIQRIDIDDPSVIATRSGIGIGTSRDKLVETYPDNIQDADEVTVGGNAMGFIPNDESDANYRIYFEFDEEGTTIVRMRSGITPAVDFTEGCS